MNCATAIFQQPTIAEAMRRPYDNFMLTRLALALAVVVSHAYSVTTGGNEPLAGATGFTLGEHAVNGFFAISGFLVTMSFERRGWRDYIVARTLRIAPAFAVAVFAAVAFGAVLTRLGSAEYWSDPQLSRFIVTTLTQFKSAGALPGVFEQNPFRYPLGTVWTLRYEVLCYLSVFVFGLLGLIRRDVVLGLALCLFAAVAGLDFFAPDAGKAVETSLRLPFIFAAAAALYLFRDRVRVSALLLALLALTAWAAEGSFLYKALLFLADTYGVLWVALAPGLSRPWCRVGTDLSYGTYLYGWPVQQMLRQWRPEAAPLSTLPLTIVLTLVIAALSWFLVEKPALGLKERLVARPVAKPASAVP